MNDVSIILSYFSPVGAKLPAQHFSRTLALAVASGAEVCVSQVVKKNKAPVPTPGAHISRVFPSQEDIFFKENLWNLAAERATKKKLLFLDADVYYKREDWLQKISSALDSCDIIQPFDMCYWENPGGKGINVSLQRICWFYPLTHGLVANTSLYHPGFGFGLTRQFFDKIGGFYAQGCLGFGDTLFCAAATPDSQIQYFLDAVAQTKQNPDAPPPGDKIYWTSATKHFLADSYVAYRKNFQATPHTGGYVVGLPVYHRWHGTIKNRNYTTRMQFVDWPDKEPPVRYRRDGLLAWSVPQPRVIEWWKNRDDDGLTGGIRPAKFAPRV